MDENAVYLEDEMYLPISEKGVLVERPYYHGDGNYNIFFLEAMCRQFEKYCTQQQIIKQNCKQIIYDLKNERDSFGKK